MKLIYFNDVSSDVGYSSKMVDDNYQISADESSMTPDATLIPPMTIKNGQWVGQDFNTKETPVLTQQDEINANLFKMNLDLQLQLKELKSNE